MTRILACLVAVLAAASPAAAQDSAPLPGPDVVRSVDWAAGRVVVEATRALDPSTPSLVRAKADAETDIDQRLPDALSRALGPLTVDSSHVLSDYLNADPELFARLNDIAVHAPRTDLFLTGDFTSLVARYAIPLFGDRGIGSPFYPSKATPIRRRLGDVATRAYTGLLILPGECSRQPGTSRMAAARPVLFPRIWDEQMNLVLDKDRCAPDSLRLGNGGLLRVSRRPCRRAARGRRAPPPCRPRGVR